MTTATIDRELADNVAGREKLAAKLSVYAQTIGADIHVEPGFAQVGIALDGMLVNLPSLDYDAGCRAIDDLVAIAAHAPQPTTPPEAASPQFPDRCENCGCARRRPKANRFYGYQCWSTTPAQMDARSDWYGGKQPPPSSPPTR